MKTFIITALCFISCMAFAQDNNSSWLDSLEYRFYDVINYSDCPEHIPVPGEPVPDYFPYAKYANDTSMWEWVPLNIEGIKIKQTHIYDLKPQYKDTLVRNDGSVVEVPIWIKYPDWVKEE